MSYLKPKVKMAKKWASKRTENDNFYYDLTPKNHLEIIGLVSAVTGEDRLVVASYLDEIVADRQLERHITQFIRSDKRLRDSCAGLGRRIAWYAMIRSMKPSLVVETGVHHGVGSCVIAAALLRNRDEGFEGRHIGTDFDPNAGILISEPFSQVSTILRGDSIESLLKLSEPVDLFINDSDHSGAYEREEYITITPMLTSRAVIIGDNSHATTELAEYSFRRGRKYLFLREEPKEHWYPGAGIGVSYP
jgi:hypothetical protein